MKHLGLLLAVLSCWGIMAWGALPDIVTDPATRDVVEYLDAKAVAFTAPVLNKTEIAAKKGIVGGLIVCSNCSTAYSVCVGTKTITGGWVLINTANKCQ